MNTYHFGQVVLYTVGVQADSHEEARQKLPDIFDWVQEIKPIKVIFVDLDTDGGGSPNDD